MMNGREMLERLQTLVDSGYGDEEVLLDTGSFGLDQVGEVDIDSDRIGIIIWKVV